uniref:Uncharacterized protein n=1 Tax=Haptolina ericina TaxID=156174 RepID=A0A7S3AU38_9EUKA|mmetsp:Transcript_32106/g.72444  ORF Transcript_32106/g.72444 Transcript_32106/m.72444 type:complete len:303 (+) Transcript_32106:80-988(+)
MWGDGTIPPAVALRGGHGSRLLMEYLVGPTVVRDCGCGDAKLVLCPPRQMGPHNATARPQYEPFGLYNAAGGAVEIYMKTAACETLLRRVEEHGQVYLASYAGQSFRVRRADDQRLLMQQTVGEVIIRHCDTPTATVRAGSLGGWDGTGWDGKSSDGTPGESTSEGAAAAAARVEGLERRLAEMEGLLSDHRRWTGNQLDRVVKHLAGERQRVSSEIYERLSASSSRIEVLEQHIPQHLRKHAGAAEGEQGAAGTEASVEEQQQQHGQQQHGRDSDSDSDSDPGGTIHQVGVGANGQAGLAG